MQGAKPSDAYCRQDLDQNGLNFELNLAHFNRDLVNLVEDLRLRWELKTAERLRDIAENNPGAVVKVGAIPVFVKMLGDGALPPAPTRCTSQRLSSNWQVVHG